MKEKEGATRRDFLKTCVAGTVAGTVAIGAGDVLAYAAQTAKTAGAKSKVVVARDAALRNSSGSVDPNRMLALLDRAMQSYFGTKDPLAPWKKLVSPGQVVGLKVNTIAGRGLSTNTLLVEAIADRLQKVGIKPYDIIIWDRTSRELQRAGFTLSKEPGKIRCMGTDEVGYESQPESFGSVKCPMSKILTQMCNVVINVPILKDHGGAGITLSMKNMYGVIQNPNECHANGCNPAVADINMMPSIKNKVQFTIADLTTCGFDGGPSFRPGLNWNHDGIMVSGDRVAIDHIGYQIVDRKRVEKGLKNLQDTGRPPRYIATAADDQHKLGTNDPARIALVEV